MCNTAATYELRSAEQVQSSDAHAVCMDNYSTYAPGGYMWGHHRISLLFVMHHTKSTPTVSAS